MKIKVKKIGCEKRKEDKDYFQKWQRTRALQIMNKKKEKKLAYEI